jgi:hypothetical protein
MNKAMVAVCALVAVAVVAFLAMTDVLNYPAAIGVGIALLLAAGLELNRKKRQR